MNSDRFVISRADGYDPQLIYSLTQEQRQKIGSYEQALFGALFNRTLPPGVRISSRLLPGQEHVESNETRAIRNLSQNIPNAPVTTLDMPNIADDYYVHSVAVCGQNAAVILGSTCYVVSNIASKARRVKELFTRGDGTYGLACVEWLNATTIVVGYQRSSSLLLIDVAGRKNHKAQTALNHIALGQLSRITRLSDTVFLTGYKNGQVVYNNATTGESCPLLGLQRTDETVCSIVPSHRAEQIAIGYNDGAVDVYKITGEKRVALVRSYVSASRAGKRALTWLPGNQTQFISGGGLADPVLRLFTIQRGEPMATYKLPFAINNIVFTGRRQFVATYGNRIGHFIVWDDKITQIKEVSTSSNERLLDAAYSPEAGLLTSSAAESLDIWPLASAESDKARGIRLDLIR